jgi:hypothetical protein
MPSAAASRNHKRRGALSPSLWPWRGTSTPRVRKCHGCIARVVQSGFYNLALARLFLSRASAGHARSAGQDGSERAVAFLQRSEGRNGGERHSDCGGSVSGAINETPRRKIDAFIKETSRCFGAPPVSIILRRRGVTTMAYDKTNRGALFRNDDKDPSDDKERLQRQPRRRGH